MHFPFYLLCALMFLTSPLYANSLGLDQVKRPEYHIAHIKNKPLPEEERGRCFSYSKTPMITLEGDPERDMAKLKEFAADIDSLTLFIPTHAGALTSFLANYTQTVVSFVQFQNDLENANGLRELADNTRKYADAARKRYSATNKDDHEKRYVYSVQYYNWLDLSLKYYNGSVYRKGQRDKAEDDFYESGFKTLVAGVSAKNANTTQKLNRKEYGIEVAKNHMSDVAVGADAKHFRFNKTTSGRDITVNKKLDIKSDNCAHGADIKIGKKEKMRCKFGEPHKYCDQIEAGLYMKNLKKTCKQIYNGRPTRPTETHLREACVKISSLKN